MSGLWAQDQADQAPNIENARTQIKAYSDLSHLEDLLAFQLTAVGIDFRREYRAVPGRRFRWDFYIPPDLLVEIQGGIWMPQRTGHTRGSGVWRDTEKQNLAAVLGYHTMAFIPNDIVSGRALRMIENYLERAAAQSADDAHASGANFTETRRKSNDTNNERARRGKWRARK